LRLFQACYQPSVASGSGLGDPVLKLVNRDDRVLNIRRRQDGNTPAAPALRCNRSALPPPVPESKAFS
jgi:hypothetical protein